MTTPETIGIIAIGLTLLGLIGRGARVLWVAIKEMPAKVLEQQLEHERKFVHVSPDIEKRAYDETRLWREKIENRTERILEELLKRK